MSAVRRERCVFRGVGRGTLFAFVVGALLLVQPSGAADASLSLPAWACPLSPTPTPIDQVVDAQVPQVLRGSSTQKTKAQLRNLYAAPDWRPETHPTMPSIVASGRKPGVFACAYCHQPNGVGRPENANLTGLSAAYMERQLADYRAGRRRSSVAAMVPQTLMARIAVQATREELDAAVGYFRSLPVKSTVSVVEADAVPRSEPSGWALIPFASGGSEPLGERIVELPDDPKATELRDPAASFTAYVPQGAIRRGQALARLDDSARACAACHGPALRGSGNAPPIAGRSPSYLVRQLIDFKSGARAGVMSGPMQAVVAAMSEGDMVAADAYAASLEP